MLKILLLLFIAIPLQAVELSFSCGPVGPSLELCQQQVAKWEEKTGHKVKVLSAPKAAGARLALYQQQLSAKSPDLDIFQSEIVWAGILAPYSLDLNPYFDTETLAEFFPNSIANNNVGDQLVALPWSVETGVLYYRKDLLEKYDRPAPKSWEELTQTARYIQQQENPLRSERAQRKLWGYIFQGRAYEGLTCNALEWIDGFNGGRLVDTDGDITLNNPQAIAALNMVKNWISPAKGSNIPPISPYSVLHYTEEDSRSLFQAGNAVFMRNWPYAWPLVNANNSPVSGKVGVTLLPAGNNPETKNNAVGANITGTPTTGTLGGQHLAIAKHTKYRAEAIDLLKFLLSDPILEERAIILAKDPPKPALYQDISIMHSRPYLKAAFKLYNGGAILRPAGIAGQNYNQISTELWSGIHNVISGNADAAQTLEDIAYNIELILQQ